MLTIPIAFYILAKLEANSQFPSMHLPTCSFRLLPSIALCLGSSFFAPLSAESIRKQAPGKVIVANVVDKVEAIHPKQPSPRRLEERAIISENHTVNAANASTATLVFSNGATICVQENCTLVISEFLQDPFSTPFAMPIATEEPTTSTTKLNLKSGEVVCKVKKLRADEGSTLTINTPVGAAGVRGTTFSISYLPNQNGTDRGTFTLSVTEGEVSLTDNDGNVTIVAAGEEIVISFRSGRDPVTGADIVTEIINQQVRAIPAARLNRINQIAARGQTDTELIIFDPSEVNVLDTLQALSAPVAPVNPTPVTEVNPRSNSVSD